MSVTPWTPEEEALFLRGLSDEQIMAATGRGFESVSRKRRRMLSQSETFSESVAGEKDRVKTAFAKKHARRLVEEKASLEMLVEALREAVTAIPYQAPHVATPEYLGEEQEEEAVLLLGDLQVGELVDITATGGLGHYNRDVFDLRADLLKHKVERILSGHQQMYPIRTLNIFGLGDFVEGMNIYPGQLSHLDMDLIEQVFVGAAKVAELVVYWTGLVEHINLFGVLGNHGRIGRKGELPTTANMDFLFLKHVELLLKEYIDQGRVTCEFPKTFFQVVERQNHRFMLVHGDDIRGWMSLPWYGAQRAVQKWQELIQERFDYFIFGHHHTTAQWESNHKEVIANGSFVGTNEYSAKALNVGGRPSQLLFGLHPRNGRTWTYRLFLDEGEPEKRITVYRGHPQ
jgi:hypothetical protein